MQLHSSYSSPDFKYSRHQAGLTFNPSLAECPSFNSQTQDDVLENSTHALPSGRAYDTVVVVNSKPKHLGINTSVQTGVPALTDGMSPTSNNLYSPNTDSNSVFSAAPSVSIPISVVSESISPGRQGHNLQIESHQPKQNINVLATISEVLPYGNEIKPERGGDKALRPSIALVERTAAAKVFFETRYTSTGPEERTARSLRRRNMEISLIATKKSPSEQEEIRQGFFQAETDHLRELRNLKQRNTVHARGISAAGYEIVRILGKGSFGVVSLVREKARDGARPTSRIGAVYAMKVIRKSEMLRNSQEGHLRAERDFLVSCAENSRWVVPLVASFQDMDNLYLVMEFEIGGDFLNFLLNAEGGIIPEGWTRWYVAEMVLCVEEAHRMKWIHRDVKPDNFLISASGHLKISDFGLAFDGHWAHTQAYYNNHRYSLLENLGIQIDGGSEDKPGPSLPKGELTIGPSSIKAKKSLESRFCQRKLAKSIVGTSQYMAPEVVSGQWYDGRCDWWSIGIIAFECLYGFTPFCREDRDATKKAVACHATEFTFPTSHQPISHEAKHLISRLLQRKQARLCSRRYMQNDYRRDNRGLAVPLLEGDKSSKDYAGHHVYPNDAEDIKSHPFFAGIPWDFMHMTRPPFVPRVKREDSTKYFDSEEQILAEFSSIDSSLAAVVDVGKERLLAAGIDGINGMDGERDSKKAPMPKRRPRDRLLRNPKVAKTVLEVRKKGAFLGYTYRRPKTWSLGDDIRLASNLARIGFD